MARNIEIKVRIESVEALTAKVAALADQDPVEIMQDDTFFTCKRGRLKLHVFSTNAGELIFYQRPNQTGPKESFFIISPTAAPDSLREALSLACGQAGRIRTYRTLYLFGRTRIHLDRVEGLGISLNSMSYFRRVSNRRQVSRRPQPHGRTRHCSRRSHLICFALQGM